MLFRGKLFWKYLIVILLLAGTVLTATSAIELYASYQYSEQVAVELEREKAAALVSRIEQFIEPVAATTGRAAAKSNAQDDKSATSQELVDKAVEFNRLLRDVPDISGLQLLDEQGKERLIILRSAPADVNSGVDRIIQKHASERDTILKEVGRTLAAYVRRAAVNAKINADVI